MPPGVEVSGSRRTSAAENYRTTIGSARPGVSAEAATGPDRTRKRKSQQLAPPTRPVRNIGTGSGAKGLVIDGRSPEPVRLRFDALRLAVVPVEFLTDEQASAYGRFMEPPSRLELERFCFLDDADRSLIARRRGDSNRLGFALQLGVVRLLGTFSVDLAGVPSVVVDFIADQLGIADRSCLVAYARS
jgi:hypothetical protein